MAGRSVAIHKYIQGGSKTGAAKAQAHLRYLQFRGGEDREDGKPRLLFGAERDHVPRGEMAKLIERDEKAKVTLHKLTLSPGVNGVESKDYTREVMKELGRRKGLELQWVAVEHKNTDHSHIHVAISGRDQNGREVRFNRNDYKLIKEVGDRYLEREHQFDREIDKSQRDLKDLEYLKDRPHDRTSRALWQTLSGEKRKERPYERDDGPRRKMGRQQYRYQRAGQSSFFHIVYAGNKQQERLELEIYRHPEREPQIRQELARQKELERELKKDFDVVDLDKIMFVDYLSADRDKQQRGQVSRFEPRTKRDIHQEAHEKYENAKAKERVQGKLLNDPVLDKEIREELDQMYQNDAEILKYRKELDLDAISFKSPLGEPRKSGEKINAQGVSEEDKTKLRERLLKVDWDCEKAIEDLPDSQKIRLRDEVYSKFSSEEDLQKLDDHLKTHYEDRLDKGRYGMLKNWMQTKERQGDDCYEMVEREKLLNSPAEKQKDIEKEKEKPRGDLDNKPKKPEKTKDFPSNSNKDGKENPGKGGKFGPNKDDPDKDIEP